MGKEARIAIQIWRTACKKRHSQHSVEPDLPWGSRLERGPLHRQARAHYQQTPFQPSSAAFAFRDITHDTKGVRISWIADLRIQRLKYRSGNQEVQVRPLSMYLQQGKLQPAISPAGEAVWRVLDVIAKVHISPAFVALLDSNLREDTVCRDRERKARIIQLKSEEQRIDELRDDAYVEKLDRDDIGDSLAKHRH